MIEVPLSKGQKAGITGGVLGVLYATLVGVRYYKQKDNPNWPLILSPLPQEWTENLMLRGVPNEYVKVDVDVPSEQRELYIAVMKAWYPSARDFSFEPITGQLGAETMTAMVDPKDLQPTHERHARKIIAYTETDALNQVRKSWPGAYDIHFIKVREKIDGVRDEYRAAFKVKV